MQVLNCNECKEDFILEVEVEKLDKGTERTYFICKHCETNYTSYYTNVLIRKKMKETRVLREQQLKRLRNAKSEPGAKKIREKYRTKIEILQEETQGLMDNLKERIEGR